MTTPTPAQIVVQAGQALFGTDWQGDLARALDLNPRTVQRIAAAVAQGRDYDVPLGLVAELASVLRENARVSTDLAAAIEHLTAGSTPASRGDV